MNSIRLKRSRSGQFSIFVTTWTTTLSGMCALLLSFGLPDWADAADVAILKSSNLVAYNQAIAGFRASFPQGTVFVEYDIGGDMARGRKQTQKIHAAGASLVLAVGLKAAQLARQEISDIPVIFCMVLDPLKHDLKAPNMSGVLLEVPMDRQLSTFRLVLPKAKRLGVLYDPDKTAAFVDDARRRTKGIGLELVTKTVSSEKEVPAALRSLLPQIDALWVIPDSTVLTEDSLRFLLSTTLEAAIPVLGFSPDLVKSGALIGLSVHYDDLGRQAGSLARTILSTQVGPSLGIAQPDRLRLSLNLKTARFLGVTIPADFVSRADELYGSLGANRE